MNKVESKVKCPKCKSNSLFLIEVWTGHTIEWEQENGIFDRSYGNSDPGSPSHVEGSCKICRHRWKIRNAPQIDFVIKNDNNG